MDLLFFTPHTAPEGKPSLSRKIRTLLSREEQ
jgi:hypothetical protein